MPRQSTVVSVFLASPSDVSGERVVVDRVIKQWNAIRGKDRNLIFEVVRWETNTSSAVGVDAQDVINVQINDDYDVMIALFWTRLGTETARAASGSVEEYERALSRHRAGEPIDIGVYFKMASPSLEGFRPEQYQGVLDLRDRLKDDGVYYKDFVDEQTLDFEINLLLDRLARTFSQAHTREPINGLDENSGETPVAGVHDSSSDNGAADIGFLDVLESMEMHSQAASNFLNGTTQKLDEISNVTEASARRIEELKALGPVQPADMKPIIAEVTDGFDQFSVFVEAGVDEYAIHSAGIAEDTRNLVDVSGDFESSPEEVAEARDTFQDFIDSMSGAIESMEGFAESIRSLQRMTVRFNHSRRRLVENTEKLIDLIKYSRSVVMEAMEALPK